MAIRPLKLMISSRSDKASIDDGCGGSMTLRQARETLKVEIEAANFLGRSLVEVWINEREIGEHNQTAWDECITQAAECDLFITLWDGSAGWAVRGGSIGICEAEFTAAFASAPGKTKVIRLPKSKIAAGPAYNRDIRFLGALDAANAFEVHVQGGWPDLKAKMFQTVREQVLKLAHEGAREVRRSGGNVGKALDWSRMSFAERGNAIGRTIASSLEDRSGKAVSGDGPAAVVVELEGHELLFVCHGAPRPLSTSPGRAAVGQPFLSDHVLAARDSTAAAGPIHIVGCPKGVTENQAVSLLGFPEFTVVEGAFGVYASDTVQKIQLCLLANCTDPGSTRNAVERFVEWLTRSRELMIMAQRAASRRRIVEAIREEQSEQAT
ncbi:DUF4062 domain-containing protein [Sphingomonas sp. Leaf343]|uniref:DUF4062 domain-containing protein n=1 Tax=Sphingomonas sp. Leaf343 TaxID=1736345 RepID=UPI0006FE130B|nr:DUF4062 domain-containing protein [Sphingomonas sp. Leaf343]KQR85274.1 hypothetical protein ASG07_16530 [Sphingomonas sp. Leaf343]